MWFLLRLAFWLSLIITLLPITPSQQKSTSQVAATDALAAVIASISDIRQFCGRQPDACATGSQAIGQFGDKAQTGAKLLYRLLHEQASTVPVKGGDKPSTGDPSLSTLTPADLAIPWHEPRPRAESRAQRSSRGPPPVRAADEDGGDGKDRTSNSNVLMVCAAPLSQ
jgi:Family of unknown function (DUF5330)